MELDLRKTAADADYIAVGAGVLGFQQAQVRRKEAGERIATVAKDVQTAVDTQTTALRTQAAALRTRVSDTTTGVTDTATSTITSLDPRQWVEPVIGDVRQRVEPVIEQLKGFATSVPVQVPEQLNKAVEVGKARVQSFRGQSAN